MPEPPKVARALAEAMIQSLSGLKEYPRLEAGEDRLVKTLIAVAVSVNHAEAVVEYFDDRCPTPRELRDVADNLREKYEPPKPSERELWEREYGPPRPVRVDPSQFGLTADQREKAENEMWRAILRESGESNFSRVSWRQVYEVKERLGYELKAVERDYLARGEPAQPPPPAAPRVLPLRPELVKPLTPDDVQRAAEEYRRGKEAAANDATNENEDATEAESASDWEGEPEPDGE